MNLRLRYLLALTSLSLVDLGMNTVYIVIARDWSAIAPVIALNMVFLVGVNAAGGWLVARPLAGAPGAGADPAVAGRRLDRLATISSIWAFALAMIYTGVLFSSGAFTPPTDAVDAIPLSKRIAALMWFAVVYAIYYSFYVFFAVGNFTANVRLERDEASPPGAGPRNGRFRRRLTWVFLVLAVVPNLHLIADLTWFADIRRLQGFTTTQTVLLDLFATLLVLCVALVFVARSFDQPLRRLAEAAERVRAGSLDARAPVTSDDEVGVLTQSFNRMVEGMRERAFIRETFGKYVPESVAAAIVAGQAPIGPQLTRATILFADIEGFTAISEKMAPERVVGLLNEYFSAVIEPIERCGGVVNQFQGDAILVTFNVPAVDAEHAAHALEAALAIVDITAARRFAGVSLRARIGINTGAVVAGNVGSGDRYNYTVHGDAVNLAARLEQMNKTYGSRLLVSANTVAELGGDHRLEPVGDVEVRGKSERVRVYGLKTTTSPKTAGLETQA